MDRRVAGIVLLVVALVAVMVVPLLSGRRTAGSPVAMSFPLPPQIGDCLMAPFPGAATAGVPPEIPVTATRFGPCTGVVGGQVVGFWPDRAAADAANVGVRTAWTGPCYRAAAEYAGLDSTGRSVDFPGVVANGPAVWKPTISFSPYLLVPGDEEKRAGRSWTACVAVPTDRADYAGTLRAAFSTGEMPAEFGSCWAGTDLDDVPNTEQCTRPHTAELVATGWIRNRVEAPTAVIDQLCTDITGRILRTTDPTRGGELRLVVDRFTSGMVSRQDSALVIGCFLTSSGGQKLSGTLIGLGDRPVPLAG